MCGSAPTGGSVVNADGLLARKLDSSHISSHGADGCAAADSMRYETNYSAVDVSDACGAPSSDEISAAMTVLETKRAAIVAAIAAARLEQQKEIAGSNERKAKAEDFFDDSACKIDRLAKEAEKADKVKDSRMQGEYGQKKFIKP